MSMHLADQLLPVVRNCDNAVNGLIIRNDDVNYGAKGYEAIPLMSTSPPLIDSRLTWNTMASI